MPSRILTQFILADSLVAIPFIERLSRNRKTLTITIFLVSYFILVPLWTLFRELAIISGGIKMDSDRTMDVR